MVTGMKFSVICICLIILVDQTIVSHGFVNKDSRIVGAQPANEKDYPWHVAIAVQKPNTLMLCGGSLISRQWVLTSAQCVDEAEEFSIGIGKANLDDYETKKLLISTSAIKHEEYNKITLQHDIGLIKLPKLIVFSDRVNATRLPSRKLTFDQFDDEKVLISGHGRTKPINGDISANLTFIELKVLNLNRCADYYGTEILSFNSICASAVEGLGPCFNDTGDPIVIKESDGYATQIGIFSYFHEEGCELGYPSVYTRVGTYLDWISEKTGIQISEGNNNSNLIYVSKFVLSLSLLILLKT